MTAITLPKMPSFILPTKPVAQIGITNPTILNILGGVSVSSLTVPQTPTAHPAAAIPVPMLYQTVGTVGTTEKILASSGNDTLVAGGGAALDISSAGKGSTTFLFTEATAATGSIISFGFEHSRDHINVIGASNATIISFVANQHTTTTGTVLHLTNGSTLTLMGLGPVTASDFVHLSS